MPGKGAEGFGFVPGEQVNILFRAMGVMIFSAGLLNFMVRSHGDSATLKAVLWFNIVLHGLNFIFDMMGVANGTMELAKIGAGQVTHLFVGIGSVIYLMRIGRTS